MAPRTTRRAKAASKPEPTTSSSSQSKHTLPAASSNPPKILILPNKATAEARVVSLINPRYSKPTRYLICPETGAYEFLKIAAPKTTPRSWLIEDAATILPDNQDDTAIATTFEAQVTKGADLFVATPIDPLFLALPALATQFSSSAKRMYLASDDHLETLLSTTTPSSDDDEEDSRPQATSHLRDTLARWPTWRSTFEARMAAACDVVPGPDGPDDRLFRFSEDKLLQAVLGKARRVSEEGGLPRSLEDKFVGKALEAPVVGVKKSAVVPPVFSTEASGASETGGGSGTESQESQTSVATSASEASTAATSVADGSEEDIGGSTGEQLAAAMTASAEVVALQRLRIAFNFICSSYLPPAMAAELKKRLLAENNKALVDFAPLDDYVAKLGKLRQEALLARSATDYSSRKRGGEDDEENEMRAEKRRKKEEEEKRKKAGESLGVRRLKKVNTAGMQKLSAFFKPKGAS